jgi:hypothetical protein
MHPLSCVPTCVFCVWLNVRLNSKGCKVGGTATFSISRSYLLLDLEPRRIGIFALGGQASSDLSLVGMSLGSGRHSLDGRTGIHSGKGHSLIFSLAVATNDTRSELAEAVTIGGQVEVRWKMFLQQPRAIGFRDRTSNTRTDRRNHGHVVLIVICLRETTRVN